MIPIRLSWLHRARPSATLHEIRGLLRRANLGSESTGEGALRQVTGITGSASVQTEALPNHRGMVGRSNSLVPLNQPLCHPERSRNFAKRSFAESKDPYRAGTIGDLIRSSLTNLYSELLETFSKGAKGSPLRKTGEEISPRNLTQFCKPPHRPRASAAPP